VQRFQPPPILRLWWRRNLLTLGICRRALPTSAFPPLSNQRLPMPCPMWSSAGGRLRNPSPQKNDDAVTPRNSPAFCPVGQGVGPGSGTSPIVRSGGTERAPDVSGGLHSSNPPGLIDLPHPTSLLGWHLARHPTAQEFLHVPPAVTTPRSIPASRSGPGVLRRAFRPQATWDRAEPRVSIIPRRICMCAARRLLSASRIGIMGRKRVEGTIRRIIYRTAVTVGRRPTRPHPSAHQAWRGVGLPPPSGRPSGICRLEISPLRSAEQFLHAAGWGPYRINPRPPSYERCSAPPCRTGYVIPHPRVPAVSPHAVAHRPRAR